MCKLSRLSAKRLMLGDIKSPCRSGSLLVGASLIFATACAPRTATVSLPPMSGPVASGLEDTAPESIATDTSPSRTESAVIEAREDAASAEAARALGESSEAVLPLRAAEPVAESGNAVPDLSNSIRAADDSERGGGAEQEVAVSPEVAGELFPLDENGYVRSRIEYFTEGTGRSTIEVGLERAGLYGEMIRRIFLEEGIPEALIYMAQAESAFKPEAVSRSSARGMWQFIPARGEEYGLRQTWWIDERSDPEKSTRAAARHLKDLFGQFGDWYLTMAAYNAGPGRVANAIEGSGSTSIWHLVEERLLPPETRNYVPTIIAMAIIASDPQAWGFDIVPFPPLDTVRVAVEQATDLRVIAEHLDLPLGDIQSLNPHVLRWATPPDDDDFELVLPAGYEDVFRETVAPLAEEQRILFRHHLVQNGETLSYIARLHEIPMAVITEANGIANPDALRIGQSLVIPLSGITAGMTLPENATLASARSPEAPPSTYEIRSGDTLSELAERFGLRVADMRAWNGMTSDFLRAGHTLALRAPLSADASREPGRTSAPDESDESDENDEAIVYSVQPGDTLTRIAEAFRTSVEDLRAWNLDSDLTVIYPGDRITIPGAGSSGN